MLLYHNGSFLEALESEEPAVRQSADLIAVDARHSGVVLLHTPSIEGRDFPDWPIPFHKPSAIGVPAIEGYGRFLEGPLSAAHFAANLPLAKKLLLEFKSNLKRSAQGAKGASAR